MKHTGTSRIRTGKHWRVKNKTVGAGLVPAHINIRATTRVAPTTLGDIVGSFKSLTTNEYINGVNNNGWKPFNKRIWQRNYWEHVIRTDDDLDKIRTYINNNPHPTGEKEKLDQGNSGSSYDDVHLRYHPLFRKILRSCSTDLK